MPEGNKKKRLQHVPGMVFFLILLYFGGAAFYPSLGHAILAISSLLIMAYLAWIVVPTLNWEQKKQQKRIEKKHEDEKHQGEERH